jgi:hypothetical protein
MGGESTENRLGTQQFGSTVILPTNAALTPGGANWF